MDIRGIESSQKPALKGAAKPAAPGFDKLLGKFVNEVSDLQKQVDESVRKGASGEPEEIHDMLLAVNKAELSFRLLVEVRNKLVEAYQEVMRLPV
jgi:flagellar hook-basal body complex protein FliE